MRRRLSVIIPALNEEKQISRAVRSAFAAGASEVIVADGGSGDGTLEEARASGARISVGETVRGRQLNRAAKEANGDVLLFLHADSILPVNSAQLIERALDEGCTFGGFRIEFAESRFSLRVVAALVNLRTSLTRAPWGDQAQFILPGVFRSIGRFREIPLLEDYEIARRISRRERVLLPAAVVTSGRRFIERGVLRTTAVNWLVIALYRIGVNPERLARIYR